MCYYYTTGWTTVCFRGENIKVQLDCAEEGDDRWIAVIEARFWGPNGIESLHFGEDSPWWINADYLPNYSEPYRWNYQRLVSLAKLKSKTATNILYEQSNSHWFPTNQLFVDYFEETIRPYYNGPWF